MPVNLRPLRHPKEARMKVPHKGAKIFPISPAKLTVPIAVD